MKGGFTLPGEAGYEDLTLKMPEKWGADVIRDSDGTVLSDEILNAGYGIYSTICIIRDHNEWAKQNMDKLQQSFLMTEPVVAVETSLTIELMKDFFADQFQINESEDSMRYWQVYDRTSNHWEKEHLMQIDPRHAETREYMKNWMVNWCETHPATTVVRFTSMFYNFVWIWGSNPRNQHLYSDWASYDFTVSPKALDEFAEKYGYSLTAEDFINQGKLHVTHAPGTKEKKDLVELQPLWKVETLLWTLRNTGIVSEEHYFVSQSIDWAWVVIYI